MATRSLTATFGRLALERFYPKRISAYFLNLYDQTISFFKLIPGSLLIFRFMRDVVKRGAYEIKTPFSYTYKDKFSTETEFRTLVQLDGDCLHILPNIRPKEVSGKDHWLEAYHKAHLEHQRNTDEKLLQIAKSWDFWAILFSLPAFFAANYHFLYNIYTEGTQVIDRVIFAPADNWDWFVDFAIAGFSLYFRRRIMGLIMGNIIQISLFLLKVGRKIRAFRLRLFGKKAPAT